MADPLMLADARATRFVRPGDGAVELVGRSPAIARVQELIRRGAALDGGVLITAEAGAGVEAVARELHLRGRSARPPPTSCVNCDAGDPASVDRLLFGQPPPDARRPISSRSPPTAASPPRAAARCICTTSPSCARRRRRSWRGSPATAKSASTARRWPPRCASSPARSRASTPTSTRTASAAISTAGSRSCASICRRCAIGRTMCRRWRRGCSKTPAPTHGRPPRTFTQAALALFGALTWPGNLAELRDAVERVVADAIEDVIQIEHMLPALQLASRARAVRAGRATCAKPVSASSATTSRRSFSTTTGGWRRPPRRSGFNVPICTERLGSSGSRSCGSPSSNGTTSCARTHSPSPSPSC